MDQRVVCVVLIRDTPDVVQPVREARHALLEKFIGACAFLDVGALDVLRQFLQHLADLRLLRPQIQERHPYMAFLDIRGIVYDSVSGAIAC